MHTSASLTINEVNYLCILKCFDNFFSCFAKNWDPDVREDMEMFLLQFVPEVCLYLIFK